MKELTIIEIIAECLSLPDLKFNDFGMAAVQLNDSCIITIEEDHDKDYVYFFAEIGDSTLLSKENLVELLKSHYLFYEPEDASFGINDDNQLCLFARISIEIRCSEKICHKFKSFSFSCIEWQEKFATMIESQNDSNSSVSDNEEINLNLNNSFIRV